MLSMDPLEERGLRIPEDIALMGFNGTGLFSEKTARISTVKFRSTPWPIKRRKSC
jgi:DNA-binding LacI/PurR family transcriptional regulator